MTLDQIRYFQAVCKYGSVIRAAEHLNLSQPSVSNAIQKLEQEFGTLLFTRQNKHLTLTRAGTVLLESANDLLASADNTVKTMKLLSDHQAINLGVPPMLCSLFLPLLYGDFLTQTPDFKLNIIEDDRSGLIRMLKEDKIQMAILPHQIPLEEQYKAKELIELETVCCVSRTHRLANKGSVKMEDLKGEPLILFKNSFFQTERILERYRQKGDTPNILLDTAQVSTIQSVAASGLAIGFLFRFLLDSTPELIGIPLDPPMRAKVSLVWKRGEYLSGSMNTLIRFFSQDRS
jgi:DNA-binding transcriptional LysR family regulator